MPFSEGFYRRQFEARLATDDGAHGPPASWIQNEADLFSVPGDPEFVREAYRFYLKRDPDLGGLLYFSEMAGTLGRQAVTDEIKSSDEARREGDSKASEVPAPVVAAGPQDLPDPGETPQSDDKLELSDLPALADDAAFVTEAYVRVLGRRPDPAGLEHHLEQLRRGDARTKVLEGLAASPEALHQGRRLTWNGRPWPVPSLRARVVAAVRRARPGASRRTQFAGLEQKLQALDTRLSEQLRDDADRQRRLDQWMAALVFEIGRLGDDSRNQRQEVTSAIGAMSADVASGLQRVQSTQDSLRASTDAMAASHHDLRASIRAAQDGLRELAEETRRIRVSTEVLAAPAAVLAGNNIVATKIDGFIVGLPGEEWRLAAYHVFRGVLEPGLMRRFRESLKPGMVVADVGANVGMFTLFAARDVGPEGKVYSFEPTPRTFGILQDNVQVNGLLESGRVDLRRVAISDRKGTARLAVYPANGGHNTLFPDGTETELISVETTTLDDAIAAVPRVDVIKIDAEGAEPSIWSGMTRLLAKNPHVRIFMEFAPTHLRRAGHDPGGFLDRLRASGFQIQRIRDEDGVILDSNRDELIDVVSTNLMLTRQAT